MIKTIILVEVNEYVMVLVRRSVARRNLDVVIEVNVSNKLVDLLPINVDRRREHISRLVRRYRRYKIPLSLLYPRDAEVNVFDISANRA